MSSPRKLLVSCAIGACMLLGAGSALPCTPSPPLPPPAPGWKAPSPVEELRSAFRDAKTVAVLDVYRVEFDVRDPNHPGAGTETAFIRPLKMLKGSERDLPSSFKAEFYGTTCDRGTGLGKDTKPILFLSPEGYVIRVVQTYDRAAYEEALSLLEKSAASASGR
jgi:hypothetical protein